MWGDVALDVGVREPDPGQQDQEHGKEGRQVEAGDHVVRLPQNHHQRADEAHRRQGEDQRLVTGIEKKRDDLWFIV